MKDIKSMIDQNRPAVLAIFAKYNIDAPPTADNVTYAYIMHKEPFLVDLYREVYGEYNYDEGKEKKAYTQEEKKARWGNFVNIFTDSIGLLSGLTNAGIGAWGNYQAAKDGNYPYAADSASDNGFLPKLPPKKDNTLMYVGGGIAALILIIVLMK